MKPLYELLSLFPENFVPPLTGRVKELYCFLRIHKGLTEEKAAELFFNNPGQKTYFNNIKNKLKGHLIRQFMANPPLWANTTQKELLDTSFKNFAIYKIFLVSGKRAAAIDLATKLLPKVRQLELHTMAYEVATDLENHYATMDVSPGNTLKYVKIATDHLEIIKAEKLVRKYYSKLCVLYNTRNSFTSKMIEGFKEAMTHTYPLVQLNSPRLNRFIYNIVVMAHDVLCDHAAVLQYCDEALGAIPSDYHNSHAYRFSFLQKKIPALVALGSLEKAKTTIKDAFLLAPVGHNNWHLALLQRITVCLHTGDFQEAYDLYKAHGKYECDAVVIQEHWNIVKGYLSFLIGAGYIESYTEERFNLGKFLNEVPIHSRDKSGSNINILVIQILTNMQRGHFGRIIDRVESLNAYARKYTLHPEIARANIFINMIVKMSSTKFHLEATKRKTKKLLERLNQTPIKLGQNLTVEIVPFSFLWDEILYMLEHKFRATTVKRATKEKKPKSK